MEAPLLLFLINQNPSASGSTTRRLAQLSWPPFSPLRKKIFSIHSVSLNHGDDSELSLEATPPFLAPRLTHLKLDKLLSALQGLGEFLALDYLELLFYAPTEIDVQEDRALSDSRLGSIRNRPLSDTYRSLRSMPSTWTSCLPTPMTVLYLHWRGSSSRTCRTPRSDVSAQEEALLVETCERRSILRV